MRRTVEAMLVVAIVIDVAYWSIWFTQRDWLASEHRQAYYEFENAFPLADLWLGVACVLALVTLRRRHESALFWLLAAGSAGPLPVRDGLPVRRGERHLRQGGRGRRRGVIVLLDAGLRGDGPDLVVAAPRRAAVRVEEATP